MVPFMHTVRFVLGMAMLAGGAALARPFALAVLAARTGTGAAATAMPVTSTAPGMRSDGSSMTISAGGHTIPDGRPTVWSDGSGVPMAAGGHVPPASAPPPPAPLPASGLDLSPASPPLDGTYRSTVQIPPPPLLDVHAPPPLAAGWSVHDVAKPHSPGPSMLPAAAAAEYVIRDGDDLTGIALRVYGHAGAATAIWTANRDRLADPSVLPIGLTLRLPPSWTLPAARAPQGGGPAMAIEPTFGTVGSDGGARGGTTGEAGTPVAQAATEPSWLQAAPSQAPPAILTAAPAAAPAETAARPGTVRVAVGDSLESLAVRYYGDRTMASRIWLANRDRLRSPDLLVPGAELRLP